MNYLLRIDEIIKILAENNQLSISDEIRELKLSASNSSELLMTVVYELKQQIKKEEINVLVGKDVLNLVDYCNSVRLKIN